MVECRTPEREVRGSRPTAAVLCPWARHFTPRKYWLITQEAMAPSRHDWKIVDWDVKPQHNQPTEWNYPTYNPIPFLSDTNIYAKFEENGYTGTTTVRAQKRRAKHFWHTSRAITLLFQNEISPLAIPYHSSPIPMSMQRLKKIGQKVLKLEHRNKALMDGRTDTQSSEGIT